MTVDSAAEGQPAIEVRSPAQAFNPRYSVALLTAIFTLNCVDRQIANILAEPIKRDLGLHDWQLGMITGLAFAIFYATLGLPIARLADRANRPRLIAVSVVVWCAFTALCGLSRTFLQLVLARIGAGAGEAGCTPAAHSLISDIVPREKRASALGVYSTGGPIGVLLGISIGGLLADLWGWRSAFLVAAAPGVLAGALAAFTLKEPRSAIGATPHDAVTAPNFMAAMRELARSKTFCLFGAGSTLQSLVAYGQSAFLGSFFFRNYGPELNRAAAGLGLHAAGLLGLTLGVTAGLSGILGAYMGGKLADRHTAKGPRGLATQAALANLVATPIFILAMLVHSAPLVVGLIFFHSMISSMTYGPLFAVFQSVVQPRTRATAVAIFLLLSSLVGLGVGPLLVGVASDYLSQGLGLGAARGLVWAEVGVTLLGLLGVWYYWRARQYIVGDTVS